MNRAHSLKQKLKRRQKEVSKKLKQKHASAHKWLEAKKFNAQSARVRSQKLLTGVTLGSALLLAAPNLPLIGSTARPQITHTQAQQIIHNLKFMNDSNLTPDKEKQIAVGIEQMYDIRAVFELDKQRLPHYQGLMGLEQHLLRYPRDTLNQHRQFIRVGMAPHRGAFGYFADGQKSPAQVMQEEEYYIVLQTFLIPHWNTEWVHLKEWYAFRKFLVVNPETGDAVVAVLGDSGPAVSTGKKFGGSPEVMQKLGFYPRSHKGDVWVFFIDDPGNEVPLGPVNKN